MEIVFAAAVIFGPGRLVGVAALCVVVGRGGRQMRLALS